MAYLRKSVVAMALSNVASAHASVVRAAPTQDDAAIRIVRRQAVLSQSDMITAGNGKVPIDAILLIGVALAFALVCVFISLWHVKYPRVSNARVVIEERARAKIELRLRGGGSRRGSDMGGLEAAMADKEHKFRPGHQSSRASSQTLDSKSHLFIGNGNVSKDPLFQKPMDQKRPKLSNAMTSHTTRASRGYSVYSSNQVPSRPSAHLSRTTLNNLPTLSQNAAYSNASSSNASYYNAGELEAAAVPAHARRQMLTRDIKSSHSLHRISTSVGRGIDLSRHRSIERRSPEDRPALQGRRSQRTPIGPRPIDAAHGRISPMKGGELSRSNGTYDLSKQSSLEPGSSSSRKSSSQGHQSDNRSVASSSANGGYGRPQESYFEGAQSEEGSQATSSVQHPLLPRSPAQAERRSRPLAFYERNDTGEGLDSSAAQHFTRLLESPQARQYGRRK